MRKMVEVCIQNELKFYFVLMNSWFASKEKCEFIPGKGRHFIAALQNNRLVALSGKDREKKRLVGLDRLDFPEQTSVQGWCKDHAPAALVVRQVFANQDGNTRVLHLVCSDLTCNYDAMATSYKNGSKWRCFTNPSNPMPVWRSHRRKR